MKKASVLLMLFLLLAALGCQPASAPVTAPGPATSLPAPSSPKAPPTKFSLGSVTVTQSGKAPDYTIKTETPVMNGSDDPHVVAFNKLVSQAVQKEIEAFKKNLKDAQATPISAGSSFDLTYMLVSPPGDIVSLQLKIDVYIDGAAHPYDYTVSINYDLTQGQEITLDRLFRPGANYLQAISEYCKAELTKRDIAFDAQQHGADATPENYHNWNISAGGLVITFDEYQVAAYAAGPQVIVIPYEALKDVIDPQGPLAGFVK